MTNNVEVIDLVEEDLDYELDVEMDEDDLLGSEEELCETEIKDTEHVKQMSLMSVTPPEKQVFVTPALLLPTSIYSPNAPCAPNNDLWFKSISTFSNILNKGPTIPSNEVVEPKDTKEVEPELNENVSEPASEVITHEQSEEDSVEFERKDENEFMELRIGSNEQNDIVPIDKMDLDASESRSTFSFPENLDAKECIKINQPEGHNVMSSSSSTSPSSKRSKSKKKRNRNKNRKYLQANARQNIPTGGADKLVPSFVPAQYEALQGLMSIDTSSVNNNIQHQIQPMVISVAMNQNVASTNKKKSIIVKAQSNGDTVSRTVLVNTNFVDFPAQNISNTSHSCIRKRVLNDHNRSCTATLSSDDLRNVVMNKRRSISSLESILSVEKKEFESEEMSDEDKKYLLAINEQKLKREELIRQKDLNRARENEGWEFLE